MLYEPIFILYIIQIYRLTLTTLDERLTMRKYIFLFYFIVLMTISACGILPNSLIGEYSTQPDGKIELKVFQKGGKTYGALLLNGKWDEVEMRVATEDESIHVIGKTWPAIGKSALIYDKGLYIAHVEPGSSSGNIKFKTGYVALLGFIPAELYKK